MVKYNSVTSPEMDNIMRRVEGTEKGLEVLQAKVTDVENTLDVLRKEVTDIGNRLSGLEIKVVGLTEKLDNFIEIATRNMSDAMETKGMVDKAPDAMQASK